MCQGRSRLDKIFPERVPKHWHSLPRAMVESPSLQGFQRHRDTVLRAVD